MSGEHHADETVLRRVRVEDIAEVLALPGAVELLEAYRAIETHEGRRAAVSVVRTMAFARRWQAPRHHVSQGGD